MSNVQEYVMESNSNTTTWNESCDTDDKVQIKEEPLQYNETSSKLQQPPVPHNVMYYEMVPEKSELVICDPKKEPWHLNETTNNNKSELQEPPTSDLDPCMNTVVIKDENNIKMEIKEETFLYDTSSTQVSRSSTDTASETEEKESEPDKYELSEDEWPLESARLLTESIYPESISATFLDEESSSACDKKLCGNNVTHGTSIRQNIYSLNCNNKCDREPYGLEKLKGVNSTQTYKCESELQRQKFLQSGRKPYKCDKCQQSFTRKWSLKSHISLHSGTKQYTCEYCEKCFTTKSYLKKHAMLHSSTPPHKCEMCGKCFTRNSHLQKHILLHSGTKPYKCHLCENSFTQNSNLQTHILLHSGTKPYKCDICEKRFTQKAVLQRHALLHSGTKPYKCNTCEKFFTRKSHLQRHSLLHSGTKPYKCDICEKCFTRKSALRQHTWLHSGNKPHMASFWQQTTHVTCEMGFTQKSHL